MAPSGMDTVWEAVKKAIPDVILKRKLNFITIHYIYIVGSSLLGGIIFWAIGGVAFIDALFFSTGACTQSGLNTIDVNKLYLGQQIVCYVLMMTCNPIVIHTSVVFVRLYWFEKRFKDIVREARQLRRTRSRSRRRDSMRSEEADSLRPALSVRGRAIQLLRSSGHKADGKTMPSAASEPIVAHNEKPSGSSDTSQDHKIDEDDPKAKRRASATSMEDIRLPQQMNTEQHIQFLENQRNPKDTTTLRIPSPREFDRGGRVQSIDEASHELNRQTSYYEYGQTSPEISDAPRVANHITFEEPELPSSARHNPRASTFPRIDTGKASTLDQNTYDVGLRKGRTSSRRNSTFLRTNTARTLEAAPYLSWQPTVARNSFFVNLTEDQREELGGIEYRALKTLLLILLGYFFLFHLFGIICLVPWIYETRYGAIVTDVSQGRAWWGVFTSASAFNDLGFTLTPDSMISFQTAVFPILLMTFLIIIGNTGFPCMLRFIIWVLSKCVPVGGGLWEELQFLLDHPRRCFTLLFPRSATWWLFAILIILNGVDLLFFIILDLNDTTVTSLSPGIRVLDGLFQAASTRTAGFAAVNVANLHPAIQVSYLIMMYISVFPIAISMRRTNVYEEKSLGIYASGQDLELEDKDPSYVGAHLRKQLSFDLWYVFLGLFIICIAEGSRLENTNEYAFTIFSVLFEIVSAYGTVGLSLGYPTINASFSAEFNTISKLVIIAMQIRGRHRGLPYELDRAILLPSEGLHRKEAQEAERIMTRRRSTLSIADDRHVASRSLPEGGLVSASSYRSYRDGNASNDQTEDPQYGPRQRRMTNKSSTGTSMHSLERASSHPFRRGVGSGMYKLADTGSAIKEEAETLAHGAR